MKSLRQFLGTQFSGREPLADELAALFSLLDAPKNTVLVNTGAIWNKVFFVEQGLLRLYYLSADGREFNKGFFSGGQLVWPIAPTARSAPSLFTIAALEPCRLWVAEFDAFQRMLQAGGCWESFALPYAETLANNKFLREYDLLCKDAEARFDAAMADLAPIIDRIPDYHLASYVGVTNVTLSRIRQRRRSLT